MATDPGIVLPEHLDTIDEAILEAVAASERCRTDRPRILLIAVPPRHGKSTLISHFTPAWYLGLFPDRRVILASYEADFAASWGAKARDLLAEHGKELFGVEINKAKRAAQEWSLNGRRGGMVSVGVGGAITGRGANLLIIDDPVKNAEQAMSEVIRERQWDWWLATTRSRLEPDGLVIVLMTRWHESDLGGRLLAGHRDSGDTVREIRLPALAEERDPLGRAPGAALWPQRFSNAYLEHTRQTIGAYWWSAMYQGRPTPDEGGIFSRKDFRYFEMRDGLARLRKTDGTLLEFDSASCGKAIYIDLAVSAKETSDYTVALKVWVTPEGQMLIIDVVRERIPGPDQANFLTELYTGTTLKIESIGYQSTLVQELQRRGLSVEPVYPDKDKVTRAAAAGALYKSGTIYHRRGAAWLHDFEAELLAFPAGEHDDQVDALAYAARDLPALIMPRRRHRPRRDLGRPLSAGLLSMEF